MQQCCLALFEPWSEFAHWNSGYKERWLISMVVAYQICLSFTYFCLLVARVAIRDGISWCANCDISWYFGSCVCVFIQSLFYPILNLFYAVLILFYSNICFLFPKAACRVVLFQWLVNYICCEVRSSSCLVVVSCCCYYISRLYGSKYLTNLGTAWLFLMNFINIYYMSDA